MKNVVVVIVVVVVVVVVVVMYKGQYVTREEGAKMEPRKKVISKFLKKISFTYCWFLYC